MHIRASLRISRKNSVYVYVFQLRNSSSTEIDNLFVVGGHDTFLCVVVAHTFCHNRAETEKLNCDKRRHCHHCHNAERVGKHAAYVYMPGTKKLSPIEMM